MSFDQFQIVFIYAVETMVTKLAADTPAMLGRISTSSVNEASFVGTA